MNTSVDAPRTWPWHGIAEAEAQRLAQARERFFHDGVRPVGEVPDAVWHSWQRCLQSGLRPEAQPAFDPVSRSRVSYLSSRDHLLLTAARKPFDELEVAVGRSRCKVLLCDRNGVVLRVTRAEREDGVVLHAACRVGVDLREGLTGTTAPALTAQSGASCTVQGGEHFHELLGRVYCVAAPIRNRHGTVVGVLDLSIENQPFGFDARWLVHAYASTIEDQLRIAQTRQQILLRLHSTPGALHAPGCGLAAVEGSGHVSWINAAAAGLIGVHSADARQFHVETLLGCRVDDLLAATRAPGPRPLLLPNGLTVWMEAQFRPLGGAEEEEEAAPLRCPPAAPAAVSEVVSEVPGTLAQTSRHLIEEALAACGGNVSKAARRLGVSRGLLYRRLRGAR